MSLEVKNFSRIRWKLKIPEPGYDHILQSPKFKYRNAEFCLECEQHSSLFSGAVSLFWEPQNKKINASVPCNFTVQVQDCVTGEILPALTHSNFGHRCIWAREIPSIMQEYPGFSEHFELTFIVTVHAEESETSTGEKSVQTSLCINQILCSESLSEDLEKLLQLDSDSNPDVEFQSDGHCIKAHRFVVSARSPVLAKMLQSEMVEGTTGIIKIEDMDLDILKHFVRYLYTGRLEEAPTSEEALALYEAADKYEVNSLFRRCTQYLLENLSVENACNVLAVADAHSDKELVEKVTVFILENKMPTSDDEPWSTFCDSHSKLANKVYHRFYKRICK